MTPMPQPTAYLAFDGNCAEAMHFYEQALDARLQTLLSNGQSPMAARSCAFSYSRSRRLPRAALPRCSSACLSSRRVPTR